MHDIYRILNKEAIKSLEEIPNMDEESLRILLRAVQERNKSELEAFIDVKLMMSLSDDEYLHQLKSHADKEAFRAKISAKRQNIAKDLIRLISSSQAMSCIKVLG